MGQHRSIRQQAATEPMLAEPSQTGFPLGFCEDPGCIAEVTRVDDGDLLVLFTDGVVEMKNSSQPFTAAATWVSAIPGNMIKKLLDLKNPPRYTLDISCDMFDLTPIPLDFAVQLALRNK